MYGYDNVLGDRLTMGIAVGGIVSIWRGEGIYVEAMVRMGFIVPLASRVAFWGRAGVGTINGPELAWGNAQADVVLLAGDSFGVTLGATLDVPFDDRRKIYRALGLMLGMVWY